MNLGKIQETLLLTLYARSLDHEILCDPLAAGIVSRIDYDFARLRVKPTLVASTALRALRMDDAVRSFVRDHPDGVVVDLGCGLDTRQARVDPPSTVTWYDVDYPEVVDLRPQYIAGESRLIGTDLTKPGWMAELPADRPTMLVAEGLLPFMPGDSFPAMIRGLTRHLSEGELVLNGYTRFAAWSMKYHPTIRALGIRAAQGFDDAREAEAWGAGLHVAGELLITRDPLVERFPGAARATAHLMARSAALSRQGARVLRYRF
ncbi:MAG: class I SAM-dependent methyltransferase [Nonomuraea sp.]|nr:class I SAM-dependent methyltransferase [Nonomuraea sp.]